MITQITIKGKQHPFSYGYGALLMLENTLGGLGKGSPLYADLMLKFACFQEPDPSFPYTFDEFYKLLDDDIELRKAIDETLAKQVKAWGTSKDSPEEGKKKDGA